MLYCSCCITKFNWESHSVIGTHVPPPRSHAIPYMSATTFTCQAYRTVEWTLRKPIPLEILANINLQSDHLGGDTPIGHRAITLGQRLACVTVGHTRVISVQHLLAKLKSRW